MAYTKFFVVLVLTTLCANVFSASLLQTLQRETGNGTKVEECLGMTPCGWAVYKRFQRTVEYFMRNTCDCPAEKKCIRTEDDLSIFAYVYRCKESEPASI